MKFDERWADLAFRAILRGAVEQMHKDAMVFIHLGNLAKKLREPVRAHDPDSPLDAVSTDNWYEKEIEIRMGEIAEVFDRWVPEINAPQHATNLERVREYIALLASGESAPLPPLDEPKNAPLDFGDASTLDFSLCTPGNS